MDIETHLLIIADKNINNTEAQSSMSLLYENFREFVFNVTIKNISFTLQKEELAFSVVSKAFLKIWNSPLDWEFDNTIHSTPEDGFKAYLSTIARFKLLEELRINKPSRDNEITLIDDVDSEWKWALLDSEYEYLDKELIKKRNLVDVCLLDLPERKREIIRMYFFLYDDEKNMTSDKIAIMETMFETTWQNIRQIISRAKKTIKAALSDKLQAK